MTTSQIPDLPLLDGTAIPQLGFGVFQVDDDGAEAAVGHALDAGYRLIDTAKLYGNEAGVGGAPDLYLIHWPFPGQDLYAETWRTLVELADEGRVRSVGVSNFRPAHLERIIDDSGAVPVVNQVELHPYHQQREVREVHARHGIVTEAWSPLGRDLGVLDDPVLVAIAAAHGVSPAQVVLRWHLDLGIVAIPKSVTPERIRANLDVHGFALTEEDHARIAGLDGTGRIGPDPDRFGA
jgi:2,5-diketo-D-gluconate reductase A